LTVQGLGAGNKCPTPVAANAWALHLELAHSVRVERKSARMCSPLEHGMPYRGTRRTRPWIWAIPHQTSTFSSLSRDAGAIFRSNENYRQLMVIGSTLTVGSKDRK
jgi:hypothetical protein